MSSLQHHGRHLPTRTDIIPPPKTVTQGLRTLVATNETPPVWKVKEGRKHNETWTWYPDDEPLRSLYAGDSRAAMVPFIAHKAFEGKYKWYVCVCVGSGGVLECVCVQTGCRVWVCDERVYHRVGDVTARQHEVPT